MLIPTKGTSANPNELKEMENISTKRGTKIKIEKRQTRSIAKKFQKKKRGKHCHILDENSKFR